MMFEALCFFYVFCFFTCTTKHLQYRVLSNLLKLVLRYDTGWVYQFNVTCLVSSEFAHQTAMKFSLWNIPTRTNLLYCTVLWRCQSPHFSVPVKLERSPNLFPSLCWKDTVISQVSRAGRGHTQAIKKVTAHSAQWQAEASNPPTDIHAFTEIQIYAYRNNQLVIKVVHEHPN